jgi:GAF domain-containing protein
MAKVAATLEIPSTVGERLHLVLEAATATVPGVDAASISLLQRGRMETLAGTDSLPYELDGVQYQLDEGPCVDALRHEDFQRADDLADDKRWPCYAPKAAALGVGSQMAVRLFDDHNSVGGLNLYAFRPQAFDEDTRHIAWLFARHASLSMERAFKDEQLNEALATRNVIGQAIGMVMERYQMDEKRAFAFLVRVSSTSNIKLRDIAQELVDTANDRSQHLTS